MKSVAKALKTTLVLAALSLPAAALAQHGHDHDHGHGHGEIATCVGGPRVPSYAFFSGWDADECARRIASQGRDCARYVQVGRCEVTSYWEIDRVPADWCRCNPGSVVGRWN